MDIIFASILGAILGIVLAYGNVGQKVGSGIFISARKACNMEAPAITKNGKKNSEETEVKIDSDKV